MKKASCIILIIVMIITSLVTMTAHASNAHVYTIKDTEIVSSMVLHDEKLIIAGDAAGYAVVDITADTKATQHSLDELTPADDGYFYFNHHFVQADEGIYMLFYGIGTKDSDIDVNDYRVVLEKLELEGDTLTVSESWEINWQPVYDNIGEYAFQETLSFSFIVDGLLTGNIYDRDGIGYIATFDFEASTGILTKSDYDIVGLYRDGKLFSGKHNNNTANPMYSFSAYDPVSGNHEELFSLPSMHFYGSSYTAYDAASDTFFYVNNGELYRMQGFDVETAKCIGPININSGYVACALAIDGETYVCSSGAAIYRYDYAGTADSQTLNISNYTGFYEASDAADQAFNSTHPDIIISSVSTGDACKAIYDKSAYADVYIINVTGDNYTDILETGLIPSLDDNETIYNEVTAMYPWVQEFTTHEGHVVAVPVLMTATSTFNYYPLAFEELGLTEDDVPGSWMEFMQLMQRLPAMIADNGNISAFPTKYSWSEVRDLVFERMIESYILYMQATGQPLTFDTPLMHSLIEEFEKIDFAALGMNEVGAYSSYGVSDVLFATDNAISVYAYDHQTFGVDSPLMLSIDYGQNIQIPVDMNIAFINPYTENPDLAMEYIECIVTNNPAALKIALSPAYNQPVIYENFESDLDFFDEQIAGLEVQLETANEAELPEIEESLTYWQEKRDEYAQGLDPYAWEVSVDSIAWYRSIDDCFIVSTYCGLDYETMMLMYEQLGEYTSGSITSDDLITTLDMMVNMLVLEAE